MTRNSAPRMLALSALLAMLFVFTVAPGSSILDLNIDVGTKVLALYVAYMAWALLTALLLGKDFFTLWDTPRIAKA